MVLSALIGTPPINGTQDYWIVKCLMMTQGLIGKQSIYDGVSIPPLRPSDYHFVTQGPGIIAGSVISMLAMLIITLLRLYFRWSYNGLRWGLDDQFIIPALILSVMYPILNIVGVSIGGFGKHTYDTTYYEFYVFRLLQTLNKIVFFVGVGLVKVSITFFNMRLTSFTSRTWNIAHWIFLILVIGYTFGAFFSIVFACIPVSNSFDLISTGHSDVDAVCIPDGTLTNALSTVHVVMDFCLLSTPLFVLWKVQMKTKARLRLAFLFSIGALSCVGSVLRQIAQTKLAGLSIDPVWNTSSIITWSLVDLTFGVCAASLPMLSTLLPRALRDSSRGGASGYPSSGQPDTFVFTSITTPKSRFAFLRGAQKLPDRDGIGTLDEIELRYHSAAPAQDGGRIQTADTNQLGERTWNKVEIRASSSDIPYETTHSRSKSKH